jgi:Zn-dependent M28 family amino/carboxypeptidase
MRQARQVLAAVLLLAAGATACAATPEPGADSGVEASPVAQEGAGISVSGSKALTHVRRLVRFGPRIVGSSAHRRAQEYISAQLRQAGAEVQTVSFQARTPVGVKPVTNIIGEIPGMEDGIIVLASHYDTFNIKNFVGANDGGSSTGLLLELARVLAKRRNRYTIRFAFFDAEEAFVQWSETDSLYGSRHQAAQWQRDGTIRKIRAFILLDGVGDKNQNFKRELNSTSWLTDLIWKAAKDLGYAANFTENTTAMEDDHLPFVQAGVPAVDLIDYDFGPDNRYWHSPDDTLDKLSARNLRIVGEVVLETIKRLEAGAKKPAR